MTSSALASRRSVSKEGLREPVSKWAIELGGSLARSAKSLWLHSRRSRAARSRSWKISEGFLAVMAISTCGLDAFVEIGTT